MTTKDYERRFLAIYDAEADAIFRFCLVRLRDREAAIEVSQETFTRLWEYIARGEEVRYPRAFMFRIARNAIVDFAKKSRPLYERDLGDGAESVFEIPVAGDAETKAELAGILECMKGLSEDDQEMVTLRYTEGVPVKDIAASLGELPNTVTVRLKRALESLRECIGAPLRATS